VHAMRDLGYVEGQNLILERRSAEGHPERYREIFEDLVRLNVDVIVTVSAAMIKEAKAVTTTVPIVMGSSTVDVLNLGVVSSLAKPGGNITGNIGLFDPEIDAKRLQLLKEMLPSASRVACLSRFEEWESPWGQSVEAAAQRLGLTMVLAAHTPDNYEVALALITASSEMRFLFIPAHPNTLIGKCSSISPEKTGYRTATASEKPLRSVA